MKVIVLDDRFAGVTGHIRALAQRSSAAPALRSAAATIDVLAGWCQECRLDADLFGRLAVLARRAEGPVPTWFEDWLQAEGEAHSLRIWSPMLIPGLLQTADYARALFLAAQTDTSEEAIGALVAARWIFMWAKNLMVVLDGAAVEVPTEP